MNDLVFVDKGDLSHVGTISWQNRVVLLKCFLLKMHVPINE